jgi:diacylglycerol kinase (ATP)
MGEINRAKSTTGVAVLVVTNELAGRTEAEAVREVVAELDVDAGVEVATCSRERHLEAVLDRRAGRTVVIVGGDGSLNTLVKQLWRRGEAPDCSLGVVPMGTGNDFARGVGVPIDPRKAARLVRRARAEPMDLLVDDADNVVVNAVHLGAGAVAAVIAQPWKRFSGGRPSHLARLSPAPPPPPPPPAGGSGWRSTARW